MTEFSILGKRFTSVNVMDKVTGDAKYASDIKLPGMLHGKFLRSPHAHARIVKIDVSKAISLPGVRAVITRKDLPQIKYGPVIQDQYALAIDKVFHVGAEVAAVAAIDEEIAKEAVSLIDVEYEELSPLFHPVEAMEPDAPMIHEAENNIAYHMPLRFGDVEEGFKSSDRIFENEFRTHSTQHCCMETQGCVADFDKKGKLKVWANTSTPFGLARHLALTLGMPAGDIRIIRPYSGGSFGSKSDYPPHFTCAAFLSKVTSRPVRFVLNREEEFTASVIRHAFYIKLKTGVSKNGKIKAVAANVVVDNGAYSSYGPLVAMQAALMLVSLYRDMALSFDVSLVYTNKVRAGAMRGFGTAQIIFAAESQIDIIANALQLSPEEVRVKNMVKPGDVTPCGWKIDSCGLEECLKAVIDKSEWKLKRSRDKGQFGEDKRFKYGIGMAMFMHHCGFKGGYSDSSSMFVKVRDDNKVYVISGASDVGQGSDTVIAAIVAEILGLKLEDIVVAPVDTFYSPLDMGSYASRVTVHAGNAAKLAALDLRNQLFEVLSRKFGAKADQLEAKDGHIYVRNDPDKRVSFGEAYIACQADGRGMDLLGKGTYDPPTEPMDPRTGISNYSIAYPFGALVAEVEVDTATGIVSVKKLTAAHDLGRVISQNNAEGQVEGANLMGMGYALTEETTWEKGEIKNPSFVDYRILTAKDIPEMETIFVETVDPHCPFGAKGHSEAGLVPIAPAIANAVYDAVGVRITDLPITPSKVLNALEEARGLSD